MSQEFAGAFEICADAAGLRVDEGARQQFEAYYAVLRRWNEKISLTSLPLEGYPQKSLNRLLIEPALAAEFLPKGPCQLLDLGSGGGSPAIPLKILRPEMSLTMTEARQKKVMFLREASSSLGLSDVNVLSGRIEEQRWRQQFDWVSLRAVRIDSALVTVIRAALASSGRVLLFGSLELGRDDGFREVERRTLPGGSPLVVLSYED